MRSLGYKVEALSAGGTPLAPGKIGELACTAPAMSMPLRFWNDPGDAKYLKAYFEIADEDTGEVRQTPGTWWHHDFVEITDAGGMVVYGRSDDTINRQGVRMGSAEIEGPALEVPEVQDALVVNHRPKGAEDEDIILFVVLKPGVEMDEALAARIKARIRTAATPRHVPQRVIAVPEIPKTVSGKTPAGAVRKTLSGKPVPNLGALKNPGALAHFQDIPGL
jgi:acetoacetyl-CoA synthetase